MFLALDLEGAVVPVEFEGDAHGGVHLEVVARVRVVVLRVRRLERAHPPGGQVTGPARHHLVAEMGKIDLLKIEPVLMGLNLAVETLASQKWGFCVLIEILKQLEFSEQFEFPDNWAESR